MVPGSRKYLNIEVNPVGVLLMASGEGRGNRLDRTETLKENISVQGSHIGQESFDIEADFWEISLGIQPEVIGLPAWSPEIPLSCNIYKCGDNLDLPHYLSLAPLSCEQPDFHRPQDFIGMELQN